VPQEAFDIAHSYTKQYGNELTDTLINRLLTSLNAAWRKREKRQIARVKKNCNSQVQKLRRQISNMGGTGSISVSHSKSGGLRGNGVLPLAEFNDKTQITRLKQQLSDTRAKLREAVILRKKNLREVDMTENVETAFKVAGDWQTERNRVIQENKMLKVRLQDAEKLHHNEDFERAKFMQGASWQATKSLNENRELLSKAESVIAEFKTHERNLHLKGDANGLQLFREKNHEIVLDELQEAMKESSMKLQKMMEVATEHYSVSQGQVDTLGGAGSYIPYTS